MNDTKQQQVNGIFRRAIELQKQTSEQLSANTLVVDIQDGRDKMREQLLYRAWNLPIEEIERQDFRDPDAVAKAATVIIKDGNRVRCLKARYARSSREEDLEFFLLRQHTIGRTAELEYVFTKKEEPHA